MSQVASTMKVRRSGLLALVSGALVLAAMLTCATLAVDSAVITSLAQRDDLVFGWPFGWVQQSQAIDPPLPWRVQFGSPWENPTDVLWPQFLASTLTIWVVLVAVGVAVRSLWRRLR